MLPVFPVTVGVLEELGLPEFRSGGGGCSVFAAYMTVPEAAVNKDADVIFR